MCRHLCRIGKKCRETLVRAFDCDNGVVGVQQRRPDTLITALLHRHNAVVARLETT